jgi:capsular polysaccharide transport system permease protein
MTRQMVGRYGRGSLGFLWLIVEPMFLVSGIVALWSFLYPGGKHGMPVAMFVLSGYMPLTLWRHLSSVPKLMTMSIGLLYHRRITMFDVILARAILEIAAVSATGITVYLMLLSFGLIDWIADPALLLAGWGLMCWFSFGFGCLIAGLSEKSDTIENFIQPVQYLLIPVSGVFFMVAWLPKTAQDLVLFVPLVHIYELMRAGFFGNTVETHYSALYAASASLLVTTVGFWSMASSRRTMAVR